MPRELVRGRPHEITGITDQTGFRLMKRQEQFGIRSTGRMAQLSGPVFREGFSDPCKRPFKAARRARRPLKTEQNQAISWRF